MIDPKHLDLAIERLMSADDFARDGKQDMARIELERVVAELLTELSVPRSSIERVENEMNQAALNAHDLAVAGVSR